MFMSDVTHYDVLNMLYGHATWIRVQKRSKITLYRVVHEEVEALLSMPSFLKVEHMYIRGKDNYNL